MLLKIMMFTMEFRGSPNFFDQPIDFTIHLTTIFTDIYLSIPAELDGSAAKNIRATSPGAAGACLSQAEACLVLAAATPFSRMAVDGPHVAKPWSSDLLSMY